VIVLKPGHHHVFISFSLLDVGDHAITKDYTSYDCLVALFGVLSRVVNVEVGSELFFILGERVMGKIEYRMIVLDGDGFVMVEHRRKQVFRVGCYVESPTGMTGVGEDDAEVDFVHMFDAINFAGVRLGFLVGF